MNRIVVVTGGTSGIGAEAVELFKNDGDTVIVLARVNRNNEKSFLRCDVGNEEDIKNCFNIIKEKYGKVDVLVNNAGYGLNGVLEFIPQGEIEKQFAVNVYGVINCSKYCLPLMPRGSKIINVSSCMALFPLPYRSMYAATKSAVLALSLSQRMEVMPLGVDLTVITPGDVKSGFTKNKAVVLETDERYGEKPIMAQKRLDNEEREHKRMPPQKVANAIFKAANRKKNKPFIIVGGKYKLLYFFSRFTPKSWVEFFTSRIGGQ